MRGTRRSTARRLERRPPTSPLAPPDITERVACVIGSDADSTARIERLLVEYAALEVDRLDLDRRTLTRLSRRRYGTVVYDARPGDSVAFISEMTRRLATIAQRGVAIVVCGSPQATSGVALSRLVELTAARWVARPFDPTGFLAIMREAFHEGGAELAPVSAAVGTRPRPPA